MEILINFGLTVMGMLLHIVWKTREHIGTGFSWNKLWIENRGIFTWSLIFMAITSIIIAISPEAAEAITTLTGLDVVGHKGAMVFLGVTLVSSTREVIKTKAKGKELKINQ